MCLSARARRDKKLCELSKNTLAVYTLADEAPAPGWVIEGPLHGWISLVPLIGNSLLVYGSCEAVLFRWYDVDFHLERGVCRTASSSVDYLAESARMCSGRTYYEHDREVLLGDLEELIDEYARDSHLLGIKASYQAGDISYLTVRERLSAWSHNTITRYTDLDFDHYGMAVKPSIYFSRAAAARLMALQGWDSERDHAPCVVSGVVVS